jgi:hypothetical protein
VKTQKYKKNGNKGIFAEQETFQKLVQMSNPLDKISNIIDFMIFRGVLEKYLFNSDKKNNAGASKRFSLISVFYRGIKAKWNFPANGFMKSFKKK